MKELRDRKAREMIEQNRLREREIREQNRLEHQRILKIVETAHWRSLSVKEQEDERKNGVLCYYKMRDERVKAYKNKRSGIQKARSWKEIYECKEFNSWKYSKTNQAS